MFNAIKYSKQLEEAGFSREQAEAQLEVMTEILEGDLTTKEDLKNVEMSLRNDLKTVETRLEHKIQQLEYRMTIKLGSLMILGITVMATLMKFWLPR